MFRFLLALLFTLVTSVSFATPRKIIIVRHADKLLQQNTGPTLSAKGEIRAINFALYYMKTYGAPDFVFASNPVKDTSSIRELQTVAPLLNLMQEKYPQSRTAIMHPFTSKDYAKLAKYVLGEAIFNDKVVLICWSHGKIPALAAKLGVTEKLKKWPAEDFDSVYILSYNHNGELNDFNILHNQYPVKFNGNWTDLHALVMSHA